MKTFPGFRAVDGYHCITSASRKMYLFNDYEIGEEMLFGLGAGMGFIYWNQKNIIPFLGGRRNMKNFYEDLGEKTGVKIRLNQPSSTVAAVKDLVSKLKHREPVVVYADMAFLPYFHTGDEHFGEHTIVVAGYDPDTEEVLISDNDPEMTGIKKAVLVEMPLKQLTLARSSSFKPFPAKNRWLSFDFEGRRKVTEKDLYDSIGKVVESMLKPPIKNLGIPGIRTAAERIRKWPR